MYPSWPTTLVPLRKLEIKCENPLTVPPHSSAITERCVRAVACGDFAINLLCIHVWYAIIHEQTRLHMRIGIYLGAPL